MISRACSQTISRGTWWTARLWRCERRPRLSTSPGKRSRGRRKQAHSQNTLGVAHYRANELQSALVALRLSVELRSGGDCADFFFLAMAYERLGDRKQARTWYDKAVQWMDKRSLQAEADIRYRAEANEILGIKE